MFSKVWSTTHQDSDIDWKGSTPDHLPGIVRAIARRGDWGGSRGDDQSVAMPVGAARLLVKGGRAFQLSGHEPRQGGGVRLAIAALIKTPVGKHKGRPTGGSPYSLGEVVGLRKQSKATPSQISSFGEGAAAGTVGAPRQPR